MPARLASANAARNLLHRVLSGSSLRAVIVARTGERWDQTPPPLPTIGNLRRRTCSMMAPFALNDVPGP